MAEQTLIERAVIFQNAFHGELTKYVNGGILCRSDLFLSVFVPLVIFSRHAEAIIQKYKRFLNEMSTGTTSELHVRIDSYEGQNQHVCQMMSFLEEHLREDLIGAYVHGSLGTYEEIAYSDFDALVVFKGEVFESPRRLVRAVKKLNHARTIMLDFDPLQHHGWFVLTELDLKFYCNAYFPVELFKYSKSLFNDKGLELDISLREDNSEVHEVLWDMASAIIRKIENHYYPTNMYQLKSLLSEFMLLPALYMQAKEGRGIYKKESFDLARVGFDSADWTIMDKASEIRTNWNYEISAFKGWMMSHTYFLSRFFAKRYGPKIPEKIGCVLTSEFYTRMEKLALLMKEVLA